MFKENDKGCGRVFYFLHFILNCIYYEFISRQDFVLPSVQFSFFFSFFEKKKARKKQT